MRKTTASVILTASIVAGAVSTEVIFDYMQHDTAQDLRDCSDSIGENGCRTSFLSGYVKPIVDLEDGVYKESFSPASLTQAADQIDESVNGVHYQTLLVGGLIGFMLGGSILFYDATEGRDRRDRNKVTKLASV